MSPNIVVKGRWTSKRLTVKSEHWYKWTKLSSQCLFLKATFSGSVMRKTLSRHENPIEAYRLLRIFLLLTKRLEKCKWEWGMDKLGVEAIDTTKQYKNFWCVFTRYLFHHLWAKLSKLFHWISLYLRQMCTSTWCIAHQRKLHYWKLVFDWIFTARNEAGAR